MVYTILWKGILVISIWMYILKDNVKKEYVDEYMAYI